MRLRINCSAKSTWVIGLLLIVAPAISADRDASDDQPILTPSLAFSGIVSPFGMDVSRDGNLLVTGGFDGEAVLWDVATGMELRRFLGHTEAITTVAFSPDGMNVLTASMNTTRIWDVLTGDELRRLDAGFNPSIAYSPDGRSILTGSRTLDSRGLILWDAGTGVEQQRFTTRATESVAFSPDGQLFASADSTGAISLWDVASGEKVLHIFGHGKITESIEFSPDSTKILSTARDGTARLWDCRSGEELRRFLHDSDRVQYATYSPDGNFVVTVARFTAHIWDVNTGEKLSQFDPPVGSVAFLPDSRFLLVNSGRITRLIELETEAEVRSFKGLTFMGGGAAFSPDGTRILMAGGGKVAVWDAAIGGVQRRIGLPASSSFFLFPDSRTVLIHHQDEPSQLWDMATGRELSRLGNSGAIYGPTSTAISHDGRTILIGAGKRANLWDVETGAVRFFDGHTDHVQAVTFSAESDMALTGSWDRTARLWDTATGEELHRFENDAPIGVVAFSPDGRWAITGDWKDQTTFWELETGLGLAASYDLGALRVVAFSEDGRYAATINADLIRIWDPTSPEVIFFSNAQARLHWKRLLTINPNVSPIDNVSFSGDGRFIIVSGGTGVAQLWAIESGIKVADLYSFVDGTWAVVDPTGRYDASNRGDIQALHWVIGMEPIKLSQLKDRYYEPGLLATILGLNEEIVRDVPLFSDVKLYPHVNVEAPTANSPSLKINLQSRGGGLGQIVVAINGTEIEADARSQGFDETADEASIAVNVVDHPYMVPGTDNSIEVKAYNTEGTLVSRGETVTWSAPGVADAPELWAVIAGVSDYSGDSLDLSFAAKDAADFAAALEPGAELLFGADKVHMTLLSTHNDSADLTPTRENLVLALQDLAAAKPNDVVLVYLAGHGIAQGGQEEDYLFLTQEATSTALSEQAVRSAVTLSSTELRELMFRIPAAGKKVLILDTCGAGRVLEHVNRSYSVPASQIRALDNMKDRAGLFILAGSAADAVSYEDSAYGHGLLTYSLLEGMSGAGPLRADEFLDVLMWLTHAATRVPELAAEINGVQQPLMGTPPQMTGSFDVARMTDTEQRNIRLISLRPSVIRASFGVPGSGNDQLGLTLAVTAALRELGSLGADRPFDFHDTDVFADGYKLSGTYESNATTDEIVVDVYLSQDNEVVTNKRVAGALSQMDSLVDDIIAVAVDKL